MYVLEYGLHAKSHWHVQSANKAVLSNLKGIVYGYAKKNAWVPVFFALTFDECILAIPVLENKIALEREKHARNLGNSKR